MAQQVIPAAQLVPIFHTIGRCNNYTVLQSIPCSPECKIIGQILLDHPLSYALTATADFIYTVDMFRDILHLPMETPKNPFVTPVNIETIEAFMNRVGYQGVVDKIKINILQLFPAMINQTNVDYAALLWWDFMNNMRQKKKAIQYPRFIKLIIANLIKKFLEIPQRIEEDYHSIKDEIPLEIRATDDFKEYEMVFMTVDVSMNQPQPVGSTQEMHMSTPRAHRTPTLTASPQGKKRKQSARESSSPRQSHKITIKRKKPSTTPIPPPSDDRERDEIVEATLLSLTLHKTALAAEAQENIAKYKKSWQKKRLKSWLKVRARESDIEIEKEKKDDVEIEKEKKDEEIEKEKNNDNVEEMDKVVKEKDIVDDVIVSEELTANVSPATATTSKASYITKHKKQSISFRSKTLPGSIAVLDHCNKVVPDTTFAKTKELITQEMPHLVNLAVNKDREVGPINAKEMIAKEFATHGPKMIAELFRKHMQNTTLNLYPTTSTSTAGKSSADLQNQLYLNMKSKPQDQAVDPEIWEFLKAKFEKQ
ncbi:hypothetical protein Tco_0599325 [Tanacetum coccineum]